MFVGELIPEQHFITSSVSLPRRQLRFCGIKCQLGALYRIEDASRWAGGVADEFGRSRGGQVVEYSPPGGEVMSGRERRLGILVRVVTTVMVLPATGGIVGPLIEPNGSADCITIPSPTTPIS